MRNWSMQERQVLIDRAWNDVIHHRKYFGTAGVGASVIEAGDYQLFSNGVGQDEANISTGGVITLSDADSSMRGKNGTIPKGDNFVITSIGIHLGLSNQQATTPFEDNSVTSIDVTTNTLADSPIPVVDAIKSQCVFELWRNSNELLERGNLDEYPAEFGNTGFAGAGAGSFFQTNGMKTRSLTVYQVLEELDQFYGTLKVVKDIDLASTTYVGYLDFYLIGRAMTNYQAQEFVAQFGN